MAATISLQGIDEAISNLNYRNPQELKYKLVHAIRGFYEDDSSIESLQGIDAEKLIKALWDTGDDPALIKAKRKNLSSTKSSLNKDLKRLYKEGKNPEGITIGRNNSFVMSDDAKDEILSTYDPDSAKDQVASLRQIVESLSTIKEVLSNPEALDDVKGSDGLAALEDLRSTVQGLAGKIGLGEQEGRLSEVGEEKGPAEEVETDDALQEIVTEEEVGEDELSEDDVQLEEADLEDEVEEVLAVEKTEPEEAEETSEDVLEEVDVDDVPEGVEAEEELQEVELGEDSEQIDEAEDVEEVEDGDDLEEVKVADGSEEVGLPVGSLGEDVSGIGEDDQIRQAKLLAETFDGNLGTMERFYNQYLFIPEGEYIVGSQAPRRDEQPEHKVRLAPFYVGKFPVTNTLFEIFIHKTGYRTTAEKLGYSTVYHGRICKKVDEKTGSVKYVFNATTRSETVHGACWYQPSGPGSTLHNKRDHPVVHVSFEDALAFAAWTGKRLPTENEWEAAARTAHGYVFPWGEEWEKNACNVEESSFGDTTAVDAYKSLKNELGIVDSLGNVLEWTSDTYEPAHNRKNGPRYNIVKGGSWISGNDIRLFSRFKVDPASASNIVGFRCVAY